MAPTRRTAVSVYILVLTVGLLLECSVTAHLDQTTEMVELRQARLPGACEKSKTNMRFLRDSDIDGDAAIETRHKEERGPVFENAVQIPLNKLIFKLAWWEKRSPQFILDAFEESRKPPKVYQVLLWIEYVQKYKSKAGGGAVFNEAYVAKNLNDFVSPMLMPAVFEAMEKSPQLKAYGQRLEKLVYKPE
ncbi:RxLR effector protein [Phytophthora megakarya]|uniref:RxLR effector protein n=1 Tax=Phytophthora megakarya TaxID=4795 RepID=A0A225V966_9STRA|nr:RxLR effector protein [Phytophthora megakarya]